MHDAHGPLGRFGPSHEEAYRLTNGLAMPADRVAVAVDPEVARKLREEESRQAEELRQSWSVERDRAITEIAASPDRTAALVRAMWEFVSFDSNDEPRARLRCDEDALRSAMPDLWPEGAAISLAESPQWESQRIADWFVERSSAPTHRLRIRKSTFFGSKSRDVDGWNFEQGATSRSTHPELGERFESIGMTSTARLVYQGGILSPRVPGANFNGHALRQMALLTGLSRDFPPISKQPPDRSEDRPYDAYAVARMIVEQQVEEGAIRFLVGRWVPAP